MKRRTKRIFIFLFVTAAAVLSAFLLSACMDDCIHQFGEWSPLIDATCQAEGTDVRTCMLCGYSEMQTHPKTDHTYGAVHITVRPTCVDTGSGTKTCTVCDATQTVTLSVNPSAHKWGTPTVRPATCTEDGESVRICELCETVDTTILPAEHKFDDTYSCHDRTCTVCHTVVAGDGNHNFINDACACGTPHPDFTISKAAERIRGAMAKTLAHDDEFSVTVTDGDAQEIMTFFPLLGELAHFYGQGSAPTLNAYTLRQHGTLYYYDLTERKAYLTSTSTLRNQISIKALFGKDLRTYQPSDDDSTFTDFAFASDGTLTLTAALSVPNGTACVTYTEQKGILTALTVRPVQSRDASKLKYAFDLSPTDKVISHPSEVKESDFTVLDTYSVHFIATIGTASERFSATTGAPTPLPVGEEADPNYCIDGWYYDTDYTMPYEESTVPYTPFPLTLYAKTSLKSGVTYLTLHINGAEIQPQRWSFPTDGASTYLENALRAAFPTPSQSTVEGLYSALGYTCLGLFTDSACTNPLGEALPEGEVTAYLKVAPYLRLTLKFPTDLPDYPADFSYYYPTTAVPSVSAKTFLNEANSRSGMYFTLWLDASYTNPYTEMLPKGGMIYLKHVPQENYTFVSYLNAETGALLKRIEVELNYPTYLLNPFDLDDPDRDLICTGIWFDSDCTQSAVGELITLQGELTLYCTFDFASPDPQTLGQDAPL